MVHLFTKITLFEAKGLWTEQVWFETISVLSSWVSEEYEVRCLLHVGVKSQWDFDRDKWSLWLIGVLWETLPPTPLQLSCETEILKYCETEILTKHEILTTEIFWSHPGSWISPCLRLKLFSHALCLLNQWLFFSHLWSQLEIFHIFKCSYEKNTILQSILWTLQEIILKRIWPQFVNKKTL